MAPEIRRHKRTNRLACLPFVLVGWAYADADGHIFAVFVSGRRQRRIVVTKMRHSVQRQTAATTSESFLVSVIRARGVWRASEDARGFLFRACGNYVPRRMSRVALGFV